MLKGLKLKVFSQRLCPLLSLAIAATGCGKKINEGSTNSALTSEHQELPSSLVLKLNTSGKTKITYAVPRNGNILLPEVLLVRQGSGAGKKVVITYNLEEGTDDEYMFKCTYQSTVQVEELPLIGCEDVFGGNFGNVSNQQFPIYYGKYIQLELKSPSTPDLIIDAVYTVDWK